ncbi:MAG: peptidylprolyl isomerase [Planctomycetota bacterium]
MIRPSLALFLFACSLPFAAAQDIPGVRTTLTAESSLVRGGQDVSLRLVVDVDQAAEIPAGLLTGVMLDVKVDDAAGPQIRDGAGDGKVAVAAGTHIERSIKIPVGRLLPSGDAGGTVHLALQWPGLTGANCVVKVAPDLGGIALDDLDLAKTKVVLVTNYGEMTVAFYPDKAPNTVKNFIKLAKDGFYDGTKFHRVIRNFMIQGGDPLTKDDNMAARWGTGDPGYKINAEFNDTKHTRGVLSMARSSDPNSAGSQFFIVHADSSHLDNQYTAFGALEAGLDTLDKIASVPCGGPQRSAPIQPVILEQAVVLPVTK